MLVEPIGEIADGVLTITPTGEALIETSGQAMWARIVNGILMLKHMPSARKLVRLNRRQRKKLRVGEFQELVFEVSRRGSR